MTSSADPPASGHLPGSSGYRRVVGALVASGVATFAMIYSTQALLPELVDEFGISSAQSTLSVSLTTIGLGVTLLLAGPWSDVVGRTRLIHLSLAASTVVGLACVLAPSWPALLGLRLLQGIALAGLPAVATAYLREETHPSSHGRVAGLYIGGTALGGMAGRLVAGSVGEAAGWRWGLAANTAIGLLCALAVLALLPRSQHFRAAPTGAAALVRMARRALSDPALLALYAIGGCSSGAFVAVLNTLGFRLTGPPFDLGLGIASLVFLSYSLGSLGSALSGRLADHYGRRAVLPLACAVAVAGALLTLPSYLPLVLAGLGLLTIGFFAVHGVASGWVPARAHAGGVSSGQAASLYLFSYYLGSSVFGSLAGGAWTGAGWPGVVILSTVLLVVAALLAQRLRRTPTLLTAAP